MTGIKASRLAVLALLFGCNLHNGPPPGTIPVAECAVVNYNGLPRQDYAIGVTVEEAEKYADEMCGWKYDLCLYIAMKDGPFECGNISTASGCYPMHGIGVVQVMHEMPIWESSLPHELMHHIYVLCKGHAGADGKNVHSEEFLNDAALLAERVRLRFE